MDKRLILLLMLLISCTTNIFNVEQKELDEKCVGKWVSISDDTISYEILNNRFFRFKLDTINDSGTCFTECGQIYFDGIKMAHSGYYEVNDTLLKMILHHPVKWEWQTRLYKKETL